MLNKTYNVYKWIIYWPVFPYRWKYVQKCTCLFFLYLICIIFGICQERLHPSKIKADVGHVGRLVLLEPWKANISEKLENSFRWANKIWLIAPGLPEILDAMVDCPILHSNTSRKITVSTLKKVIHMKASTDLAGKVKVFWEGHKNRLSTIQLESKNLPLMSLVAHRFVRVDIEYLNIVCFRQVHLKTWREIFEIRHVQIDELAMTLVLTCEITW